MSETPTMLEFKSWLPNGETYEKRLRELIGEGKLPPDILFRAMHIGTYEPDPKSPDRPFHSFYWATVTDAMNNADTPLLARPWTQHLVFNKTLPDTVTDLGEHRGAGLYKHLASPYWSRNSLAKVVSQRRAAEGKAMVEAPRHSYWSGEELEEHRCEGLAQAVWRTLIRRLRPDIIEHPRWFYPDAHISLMGGARELSERTVRRNAIAHTLIKDETLRELYDEINTTGMKGIGSVGKKDIAAMLTPEHPDIMQMLAAEEGLHIEATD